MGLNFIKRITQIRNIFTSAIAQNNIHRGLQVAQFLADNLYNNPKYASNKRLNKHEYQVFSQNGEDGIIAEIFNRIGLTNKYFIEFGVTEGLECNSLNLLYKQWQGLWIDGDPEYIKKINTRFSDFIGDKRLTVRNNFITAENIESIFDGAGVPAEPDMLSIDIDYNDYYIWQAITKYRPRVVVIEYNSNFRPDTHFVVKYNAQRTYDGTSFFGASLLALEQLGREKGYVLVGCVFTGSNAFFVREDLIADHFEAPYTANNHYEPNRDFLYYINGHRRNHIPD
ncbi:hypothetical protein [Mucilaginibacter auburnensis]|uniref:Methyltransferase FkbM-like protein n=1 Tax=Mucilaginibacter auburnensis TaxID=1457233 RepID=A0A2H9VN31_9SPHI|nr:hypothetical protein [Mucilaginibacter auburnensis]PJJ79741.1 hypothetical protein CLV57_2878 [Mucilaginibacter auburnensis]